MHKAPTHDPIHPDHVTAADIADAQVELAFAERERTDAYRDSRAAFETDAQTASMLAAFHAVPHEDREASAAAWRAFDEVAMLRFPAECARDAATDAAVSLAERRLAALRAAYARQTAATQEVAQ
jgi:hypothetical protein